MTIQITHDELSGHVRRGVRSSSDALQAMIGNSITTGPPIVHLLPIVEVLSTLADAESTLAWGTLINGDGSVDGTMALLFTESDGYSFAEAIGATPDIADSGFAELGNVIASRFFIGLSDSLGFEAEPGPPAVALTANHAIIGQFIASSVDREPLVVVQDRFSVVGTNAEILMLYSLGMNMLSILESGLTLESV